MNTKEKMRKGIGFEEALFGTKPSGGDVPNIPAAKFKRFNGKNLPLPRNRKVVYFHNNMEVQYTVHEIISNEGSCGITYLMRTGENGRFVVMKEFRPKTDDVYRISNGNVDDYESVENEKQNYEIVYDKEDNELKDIEQKFEEEPKRIKGLVDMDRPGAEQELRKMNLAYPLTDCFVYKGNKYYVLSYENGKSLFDFVKTMEQELTWEEICKLMKQLCNALSHLHSICVHQDVTPYNILVNEELNLTLIDFGLATSIHPITGCGSFHPNGTDLFTDTKTHYGAYEMLFNATVTPEPIRVLDIYSIGMIFLYLCQSANYIGKNKKEMNKQLNTDKLNLGDNYASLDVVDSIDTLVEVLQQRAKVELVQDSISYDEKCQSKSCYSTNPYGPFWERPKTTDEWMKRLNYINNGIKPAVKGNPEMIQAQWNTVDIELPDTADNYEMVCLPKGEDGSDWYEVQQSYNKENIRISLKDNGLDRAREVTVFVIAGSRLVNKFLVRQEPEQQPEPVQEIVRHTSENVQLPANNGEYKTEISMEANETWSVQDAEWLALEQSKDTEGNDVISMTAEPNLTCNIRVATIELSKTVNGQNVVRQIRCVQPGCGIELDRTGSITFLDKSETVISFSTGSSYVLYVKYMGIPEHNLSDKYKWLSCRKLEERGGRERWCLSARAMENIQDRKATVVIDCCGNMKNIDCVQVWDKKLNPYLIVQEEADLKMGWRLFNVGVQASGKWEAFLPENKKWMKLENNRGNGNGRIKIMMTRNPSYFMSKKAKVIVQTVDEQNPIYRTLIVNQLRRTIPSYVWSNIGYYCKSFIKGSLFSLLLIPLMLLYKMKPDIIMQDSNDLAVSHDAVVAEWSFDAKGKWQAEVLDAHWVILQQEQGKSGTQTLKAELKPNLLYKNRKATIRLTCGDCSELLTVEQGSDRADALNDSLSLFRKQWEDSREGRAEAPDFDAMIKRLDTSRDVRGVFFLKDGTSMPNSMRIIKGEVPECRIGVTHRVVDFELGMDGKFTKIIIEPITKVQ